MLWFNPFGPPILRFRYRWSYSRHFYRGSLSSRSSSLSIPEWIWPTTANPNVSLSLNTIPWKNSTLRWFDNCSWKPSSRDHPDKSEPSHLIYSYVGHIYYLVSLSDAGHTASTQQAVIGNAAFLLETWDVIENLYLYWWVQAIFKAALPIPLIVRHKAKKRTKINYNLIKIFVLPTLLKILIDCQRTKQECSSLSHNRPVASTHLLFLPPHSWYRCY